MFPNSLVNKENIQEEIMGTTPGRKPLKTLQMAAQSTVSEGTPSDTLGKTPKQRLCSITPRSKSSRSKTKRKSAPLHLSKAYSILDEETLTRAMGTPAKLTEQLLDFEESCTLTGSAQSQALNEMLREKVFETVTKMKEKYEACLAEKDVHLNEQSSLIAQLKTEVNMLKHCHVNNNKTEVPNKMAEESKDIQDDDEVSLFVEQLLMNAVKDLNNDESHRSRENDAPAVSTTTGTEDNCDIYTSYKQSDTLEKHVSTETSMTPVQKSDSSTSVTPIRHSDSASSMTPVKLSATATSMTPNRFADSETSITPTKQVNSETWMTPVRHENSETSLTPPRDSETSMTPVQKIDTTTITTPSTPADCGTAMTPVHLLETTTSKTQVKQSPSDSSNANHQSQVHFMTTPTSQNIAEMSHTTAKQTDMVTSMTPVEQVDEHTMVTPVEKYSKAMITSPLMAALLPEMIGSLPLEILRSELESAAISNELLRGECEQLNREIENLVSLLTETKSSAEIRCHALQENIEHLQKELDKALEINQEMQLKKPHSVEEYEDVICNLQKDALLKEKQIAFCTKKATEADNLQKDLRRMYAKYNAEHQSYIALEQEMKCLVEKHDNKCSEFKSMQEELCNVKAELGEAKATIDEQEKFMLEAKKNHEKCSVLEEQMETFQSQQKENMDFMEQERKGLEETAVELEQLMKERSAELDATRQALEIKTEQCEHQRETVHSLRTQLGEVQDELNAVQSQAYLLMLEQEKELTTVSRVLQESWERAVTMVDSYKEQARKDKICKVTSNLVKSECDSNAIKDYKPSLVCQVLAAVSGKTMPTATTDTQVEEDENQLDIPLINSPPNERPTDPRDLTLTDLATSFNKLLIELEEYASVEAINEQTQMTIQQYVDEIDNLENSLEESRKQYEKIIENLKDDLENECVAAKKMQRENETKQQEIERLNLELQTVEQNVHTSRERMRDLSERYCRVIEQETENKALHEKVRIIQRECEKLNQEKSFLEKDLNETMERLRETIDANEETDLEKRNAKFQQSFTEILERKLKLQREVEKLRDSFAKSRTEKEKFAQYNGRLETKANILANNLIKAEEEIYRLDGIVERFCSVAKRNREMAMQSKELCELLQELDVAL